MYTPREARFATRSDIVSILKNAREEREEEERRRRWAEFSATKFVNILTDVFRLVRKQQQNDVSKVPLQTNYIYLHLLIPILSQSSYNITQGSAGWALQGPRDPSEEA